MNKSWWIALVVVAVVAIYAWSGYNSFVTQNEAIDGQWAQVEGQYQRRFDLIPNLVESVKGAMKQEQEVFGKLAEARTRYAGAASGTAEERASATKEVDSALSRLLVVMEAYPQLKSIEAVQTFMSQLEGTENRVSVERGRYNDAVRFFNASVKSFPNNVLAKVFGFAERTYFEAVTGADKAPAVKF
jgi:LemA protein